MMCFSLQLAEKRKTLVDEMSIRGQETAEEQNKKMEVVQEKLRVREGGEGECWWEREGETVQWLIARVIV